MTFFNIGTGKGSSVLETIRAFENGTGEKLNYKIGPKREGDVSAVFADPKKANKILGWKSSHSLEEALVDSWNWELNLKKKKINGA
jgi:UDP-glucose 4-epimerase